jgi:hypothetical protein
MQCNTVQYNTLRYITIHGDKIPHFTNAMQFHLFYFFLLFILFFFVFSSRDFSFSISVSFSSSLRLLPSISPPASLYLSSSSSSLSLSSSIFLTFTLSISLSLTFIISIYLPLFFQLISGISLTAAKSPEFMSAIVVTIKTFIWSTCAVRLKDYSADNEVKPTPLDSASKIMESSSNTMEITSNSHEISRLQSMFKILNATDTPNITISYNILSDCAIDQNIVNTLTAAVSDGSFNRELRKNYRASVKVQKGIYLYTVPPIRAPLQLPPGNNSKGEFFKNSTFFFSHAYISFFSC